MNNENIFYGSKISIISPNSEEITTKQIPFGIRHTEIYQEIANEQNITLKNPNSDTESPKELSNHGLIVINSLLIGDEINLVIYLPENPNSLQKKVVQNHQKDFEESNILAISFKDNNRRYDLSDKRIITEIIKQKLEVNLEENRSHKR